VTPDSVGPLSRPFLIGRLPDRGTEIKVEASEAERAALAADLNLPAIRSLTASLRVTGTPRGVKVIGRVRAEIVQTCVVTLEPFESVLDEEVNVAFTEPRPPRQRTSEEEQEADLDAPDELVDGRVDLGAITAEFLALGLDPYPKKPGAALSEETLPDDPAAASPFAVLSGLRPKD
jgi:uncharacterized metal-binding protein YceD (DUF177 family)